MWSRGYAAEETKTAFARVGELGTETGSAQASLDSYFGRWVHSLFRGDFELALETAESFIREAERQARLTEAAVGHRVLGITLFCQGDFAQAPMHLGRVLN